MYNDSGFPQLRWSEFGQIVLSTHPRFESGGKVEREVLEDIHKALIAVDTLDSQSRAYLPGRQVGRWVGIKLCDAKTCMNSKVVVPRYYYVSRSGISESSPQALPLSSNFLE